MLSLNIFYLGHQYTVQVILETQQGVCMSTQEKKTIMNKT